MTKKPRYFRNTPIPDKKNPHDAPIMPSLEEETNNEEFFKQASVLFSVEQIADFKRIKSYQQFRDYCVEKEINVLF